MPLQSPEPRHEPILIHDSSEALHTAQGYSYSPKIDQTKWEQDGSNLGL